MSGDWTDPEQLNGVSTVNQARNEAWNHFLQYTEDQLDEFLSDPEEETDERIYDFLGELVDRAREFGDALERARFKNDSPDRASGDDELDAVSPYGEIAQARGVLQTIKTHLDQYSDVFCDPKYEDLRYSMENEFERGLESTENALDPNETYSSSPEVGTFSRAD